MLVNITCLDYCFVGGKNLEENMKQNSNNTQNQV